MILMNKVRFSVLMSVLLCVTFAHPAPIYGQATPNPTSQPSVSIEGFQLVSPTEGWVETDRLYWTKNAGKTWTDITPTNLNGARLAAVSFIDNQRGTVILVTQGSDMRSTYTLGRTSDAGKTWAITPLALFSNSDVGMYWGQISSLQFLDANLGWVVIRAMSSSNYNGGALFKTTDAGINWTQISLPDGNPGGPVYFLSDQIGWDVAKPMSDHLYRTQDGGQTWQSQMVGVVPSGTSERDYQLPQFVNPQDGLLTVQDSNDKIGTTLELYLTQDSGATWHLESTLAGVWPVELVDSTHWIGIVRDQNKVVQWSTTEAAAPTTLSQDPLAPIADMDFVSASTGLAQTISYDCKNQICTSQVQLLYTSDGGRTWQVLTLPHVAAAS